MPLQACQLPSGYTGVSIFLNDANLTFASIAGFVTDVMIPSRSGGGAGDWQSTFSICDVDLMMNNGSWSGTRVKFFKKDESMLPRPDAGDIVLLRNIKKTTFRGNLSLLSHMTTNFVIFSRDHIPDPVFASQYAAGGTKIESIYLHPKDAPRYDEQYYAMTMKQEYGDQIQGYVLVSDPPKGAPTGPAAQHPSLQTSTSYGLSRNHATTGTLPSGTTRPAGFKFALIRDMQVNGFYDMVVEIVKIFPTSYDYLEVYVSDYTTNKQLYDYPTPEEEAAEGRDGDTFNYIKDMKGKWEGPWGQTVLKIEVRSPHSSFIQGNVKEHHFVKLSNVRIKLSNYSKLEGNMWPDRNWPEKISVERTNPQTSDQGQALLERREQYWAKRKGVAEKGAKQAKKSKTKRISAAKKAQERAAAEQKLAEGVRELPGIQGNKHGDVPLTTIESLVASRGTLRHKDRGDHDLPFINQRRRCQVRVVDFYPPILEDFAVSQVEADVDTQSRSEYEMDLDQPVWSWDFYLLVEDSVRPKQIIKDEDVPRIWLHVSNSDGQFLFRDDACDLREDGKALDKLRQKTDIIWGNLGELKSAARSDLASEHDPKDYWSGQLSNLPFDCCIQEYGQALDDDDAMVGAEEEELGWMRLFSLCETNVL
ncbi:putative protection of telomeres protein [Elsinoe fawcettii]|nr:putative protection of telomeres protein [Elsinoe fawcettii]